MLPPWLVHRNWSDFQFCLSFGSYNYWSWLQWQFTELSVQEEDALFESLTDETVLSFLVQVSALGSAAILQLAVVWAMCITVSLHSICGTAVRSFIPMASLEAAQHSLTDPTPHNTGTAPQEVLTTPCWLFLRRSVFGSELDMHSRVHPRCCCAANDTTWS